MDMIRRFETVKEYNVFNNAETRHPLVSVIDVSKAAPRSAASSYFGFYVVFLKEVKCGDLKYGKGTYDYQEGTLVFMAPGQVVTVQNTGEVYQPKGYALVFHTDLIKGTPLGRMIHDYGFFSYQSSEALHISEREKKIVMDCFSKIEYELEHAIDKHSRKLLVDNIQLFLNYCTRFYDRQFVTRETVYSGVVEKFDNLLDQYFHENNACQKGLPTVAFFANELHFSANYFGDLIKKETGKTALEFIQLKIIELAKEKIFSAHYSVSEIAYDLGFRYPQHFTRFFKQKTGLTPNEYKQMN